jgi:mono/diheme cytochrome c family protein
MPNFGEGYSDHEIAAVVNYLTGRFGARPSALTPADIAKPRQAD